MPLSRKLVAIAVGLSIASSPSAVFAAPITFDTALPVREKGLIVREQAIWLRAGDDPSPLDRELDVLTASTVLVYDSGGFTAYVAPGLQWVTVRAILEAAVQIPVAQRRNGSGLRQDFVGRVGIRLNL
jgi:hypothetical protein